MHGSVRGMMVIGVDANAIVVHTWLMGMAGNVSIELFDDFRFVLHPLIISSSAGYSSACCCFCRPCMMYRLLDAVLGAIHPSAQARGLRAPSVR